MPAAGSAPQGPKRKNFNDLKKAAVIRHLLAVSKDGVLRRGAYKAVAEKFVCHRQSIQRLWRKCDEQQQAGVAFPQLVNGRKGKGGQNGSSSTCTTMRSPLSARSRARDSSLRSCLSLLLLGRVTIPPPTPPSTARSACGPL